MIFGINTTCDISKLSQITRLMAREIRCNNFEMVFMPNITTNHAITYTNIVFKLYRMVNLLQLAQTAGNGLN